MKLTFDIRKTDLQKLNSMTKYPSILTYHKLGERGRLLDEVQIPLAGLTIYATEKIDGTNSRIIICPDGTFIVGSREDLLWAQGDFQVALLEAAANKLGYKLVKLERKRKSKT